MKHPVIIPESFEVKNLGLDNFEVGLASDLVRVCMWLNSQDIKYSTDYVAEHNQFKVKLHQVEILPVCYDTNSEKWDKLILMPVENTSIN